MPGKFEPVPHTSEIGLKITAPTLNSFFETAARGCLSLLLNKNDLSGGRRARRRIFLTAGSLEELLVQWLNEIVFWAQARRFVPESFKLQLSAENYSLQAEAMGRLYKELALLREIKSATYHDLRIIRRSKIITAVVVFDV